MADLDADLDNARLLADACDGNTQSWKTIVDRYSGLVWAVARSHRLGDSDAADVVQTTWLRLVERLKDIREPERLGAWLGTVARRESLALLRRAQRVSPDGEIEHLVDERSEAEPPDRRLLEAERDAALHLAFDRLSDPCRRLLRVLLADPRPSYAQVAEIFGVPVGSLGPTRTRCLAALRRLLT